MALEALNSPTNMPTPFTNKYDDIDTWKKGKRSKRLRTDSPTTPTTEEEYLALCLIMLARGSPQGAAHHHPHSSSSSAHPLHLNLSYKCSVCNKAFPSYQALDGGALSQSHRLNFDFDLNMPACVENEDGRFGQIYAEQEVESPLPTKKPHVLMVKE
ncbi:hypothetical protein Gotri_007106 [Gossypium trilobum]|uniref:C2H2-type domain-containing protein n=1 Tax=Gossypium trilobum TaxID=34281 RepID=A0A7J9EEY9_9ROSI|nr:hypothetical protein [Gossypium trilobum]